MKFGGQFSGEIVGSFQAKKTNIKIPKKEFVKFIEKEQNRIQEMHDYIITELENLNEGLNNVNIEGKNTGNNIEKIIWKKDKKDLTYLISTLIELEFIAEHKHINKLISNHFAYLNTKNTPNTVESIQPQEIADLKSKIKNEEYPLQPSKEIKDVIKKLKEIK